MIVARDFKPGGPIRIDHKDIKNCVATAHALDIPIPCTAQLYEIFQTMKIHGYMEDDYASSSSISRSWPASRSRSRGPRASDHETGRIALELLQGDRRGGGGALGRII